MVRRRRVGSEWKTATLSVALFLLGTGVYFWPAISSMTNPPANWGYPRTGEGLYHFVARGDYADYEETHEAIRLPAQLWMILKETGRQFGWLYLIPTILPFLCLLRTSRNARIWMSGLIAVFVCVCPLLLVVLNPSPSPDFRETTLEFMNPFLTPMYAVLAVWTGLGLMAFASIIASKTAGTPRGR